MIGAKFLRVPNSYPYDQKKLPMPLRYRERSVGHSPGGRVESLEPDILPDIEIEGSFLESESCYDIIGNFGGQNLFEKQTHRFNFARVNGKIGGYYKAHNVPVRSRANFPGPPAGWPSDSAAATEFMARTNPSRASVDVFTFLAELRDVPRMVESVGNWLIGRKHLVSSAWRNLGEAYVNTEFGWAPLLNDLWKMIDFTETVNNRVRELRSLTSSKGLRRKYTAFDSGWITASNFSGEFYPVVTYAAEFTAVADLLYRYRKWVTGTWRPDGSFNYPLDSDGQVALARSLVFGHNLSHVQIWDLMPWSWFIDWFSTAGDVLAASRNHIGAHVTDVCVMTNAVAKWGNIRPVNNPYGATISGTNVAGWIYKGRNPVSASPSFEVTLPFLSGRQLSILAGINVASVNRRVRL